MVISVIVGVVGLLKANKGRGSSDGISREQLAVTVIRDTLTTSQLRVMTDVNFFSPKEGCPSGWEPIFEVYWPGTHESCVQSNELKRRDQAKTAKSSGRVQCSDEAGALRPVNQRLYPEVAICAKMLYNDQVMEDLTDCDSPCNPRSANLRHWAKCPIES